MVRIQLESGYLEVANGTEFPLNFGVAEVRDLSSRSGTFSKSIKLVGTDNNNQLLNHYYDVNIQEGTFDINALTTCSVIQNGLPILEDCYLQLVSVDKVQRDNGHDEGVEYTVLVKDAQADFFTTLDNKELRDLDLSDLNHTYNSTNVIASFNNTYVDGFMYPLLFTPDDEPLLSDFKPAVYLKTYWDRIHATNGFSYEWSTLSDAQFDKLIIPFNGDSPELDYTDYLVDAEKNNFYIYPATYGDDLTTWTENQDTQALFNPTTGVYNSPFYVAGGNTINFHFDVDIDFQLSNTSGANAYLVDLTGSGLTQGIDYRIKVTVNNSAGIGLSVSYFIDGASYYTTGTLPNGVNNIVNLVETFDIAITNVQPTDNITISVDVEEVAALTVTPANLEWQDGVGNPVTVDSQLKVNSFDFASNLGIQQLGFGQTVELNNYIPKKIKQKDLVKSVCMMYNLIVEPDKDNPNKLIYKHRDDYYDAGEVKDWTYKLSKERQQELKFLPDLSAKKLLMTYKQDKDAYNEIYEDATNEVYGQVEFTYDNEYVKGVDKKELIFSPTPMAWNGFGAVVPAINAASPKTEPRVLIHNAVRTCNGFSITDYGTVSSSTTDYPHVSHFDDHFNPTFDINFSPCDYYFYNPIFALTNNNLFNKYWRRTIGQINSGKMLVAYFDLSERDIQKLKLSDKIRIDNSYWNINKVIDYNANKRQLTKVELISVDEEIALPSFINKPFIGGINNETPNAVLTGDYFDTVNNDLSAKSIILGKGNTIDNNVSAFVIGDNQNVTESGIWVNGERITLPSEGVKKNIVTLSRNQTAEVELYDMIILDTANTTITLPTAEEGTMLTIKNVSSGITKAVGTIDNLSGITMTTWESVTMVSDGSKWLII
jgi:hypothetical protein